MIGVLSQVVNRVRRHHCTDQYCIRRNRLLSIRGSMIFFGQFLFLVGHCNGGRDKKDQDRQVYTFAHQHPIGRTLEASQLGYGGL